MGRRKTLAEELAELATTAPTREFDPEQDQLGIETALEATDDELPDLRGRSKAAEKKLKLRSGTVLDDKEYAGRRVSAQALLSKAGEEAAGGSESEDASDQEEEASEPEEVREADGGSRDVEDNEGDNHIMEAPGFASLRDADEEEVAALEREFEAVRAEDASALRGDWDRSAREQAKGLAVRNQRALWERMLELRILLQRCLQGANRLVRPHMHTVACQVSHELRGGFRGLSDGAAAALDQLLDLNDALLDRIPACTPSPSPAAADSGAAEVAAASGKRRRNDSSRDKDDDSLPAMKWQRVDAAYSRLAPYRDASMDRWHRKTMLMTGSGAMRGNLKALNQSLSAQVASLVKDAGPAVQRTQLTRAQAAPFLGQPHLQETGNVEDESEAAEDGQGAGDNARDPETFDDSEFYQQLLKELLEGSGADAAAMQASTQGKKKRRNVERRASKGRKLRYQVMEKLVHFMAPAERSEPPTMAAQLFSNLFGHSGPVKA